jgi:hypothetical protein
MSVLQETARMQFEAKKSARRQVHQQSSSRNNEWHGMLFYVFQDIRLLTSL